MADFIKFWPILLEQEGYYANNPKDSGGETWEGISRNNYPNWSGWNIVDEVKQSPNYPKTLEEQRKFINSNLKSNKELELKVISFYKNSQWDVILGDQINNQSVANFIADWGVNAGMSVPIKKLQTLLSLNADGKLGPKTLAAINGTDSANLFSKLKEERIKFYNSLVESRPSNKVFLNTWLRRTNSFSYTP